MKYYVTIITTEATQETPEIYGYATEKEAVSSFHNAFVTKLAYDAVTAVLAQVMTSGGAVLRKERWEKERVEGAE